MALVCPHANVPPYIRRCHGCHLAVFAVLLTCPEYPSSSMGCCRPQPQINSNSKDEADGKSSVMFCHALIHGIVIPVIPSSVARPIARSLARAAALVGTVIAACVYAYIVPHLLRDCSLNTAMTDQELLLPPMFVLPCSCCWWCWLLYDWYWHERRGGPLFIWNILQSSITGDHS